MAQETAKRLRKMFSISASMRFCSVLSASACMRSILFRDVLQIANTIYQHFFRKGIVANMFRPDYPFKIALQNDDTYPYFVGGIESKWELPVIGEEEKYI